MGKGKKIIETYVKKYGKVYRVWKYRGRTKVYWQETCFKVIPFIQINKFNQHDQKTQEEIKKIKSYQDNKTPYEQIEGDNLTQFPKKGF